MLVFQKQSKDTDLIPGVGPPAVLPSGHGAVVTMTMALLGRWRTTVAPLVSTLSAGTPVILAGSVRPLTTENKVHSPGFYTLFAIYITCPSNNMFTTIIYNSNFQKN